MGVLEGGEKEGNVTFRLLGKKVSRETRKQEKGELNSWKIYDSEVGEAQLYIHMKARIFLVNSTRQY